MKKFVLIALAGMALVRLPMLMLVRPLDAARKFVRATLRGVRDYCNAYHRGPNRDEITRILAQYSDVKDPALINQIEWGATDVHGRIFEASVSDIQDTFFKERGSSPTGCRSAKSRLRAGWVRLPPSSGRSGSSTTMASPAVADEKRARSRRAVVAGRYIRSAAIGVISLSASDTARAAARMRGRISSTRSVTR
jgi:hypothetical protein